MKDQWKEELPVDHIKDIRPASGGDVNEAFKVITDDEPYFLLVQRNQEADFYAAEQAGLNAFEEADILAPRVIANGQIDGDAYLLITYLEEGGRGDQRDLAKLMARLHQMKQPDGQFGFDYPHSGKDINFDNDWTDSWSQLFINQRMDVLRDRIVEQGLWTTEDARQYDAVREVMIKALAEHESKPSLVHGDMWGGNHMFLTDGSPALFDPAPFYGDREFDIGVTLGFGAFNQDFYDEYDRQYPLANGASLRLEFYRLYLLMFHLLKFGSIYARQVDRAMDRILTQANESSL